MDTEWQSSNNELANSIEPRLRALEEENKILRANIEYFKTQMPGAGKELPRTDLVSESFIKRAFAVWGHYFVAQIIIAAGFFVMYACFAFGLAALVGNSN